MENQFNKFQSSIEDLNIESYPLEIKEAFYDFITNVPYIKSLISPNRPYAKDCPRDEEGKIIVDLTNPPIIEDTDYFRPTAIHYQKYGCMTKLRPNPNPNSEYGKWVREETKRCFLGYVRPSDGAWVTGEMYFFLNYCPIVKVKRIKGKQGIRVVDFPDFLEGQWLKFMYIHQARENAKHGSELASRGKGKSYCMASILAKRFILGEYNPIDKKIENKVESFVASYLKNYLNEDGVLNKFESYIDFCSEATEFPKKRLINSINQMHWQMGYKENESVAKKGSLNEVIGVSVKDSPGKLRGKRGAFIGLEEFGSFPNLIELYGTLRPSMEDGDVVFGMIYCQGCVCAGTKVWTLDGSNIDIENLTTEDGIIGYTMEGISKQAIGTLLAPSTKQCVEVVLSNGNTLRCSIDHPILKQILHTPRVHGTEKRCYIYEEGFVPASMLKVGDKICEAREIGIFGNSTLFDARFIGMLIGDGSYGYNNTPKYGSQDIELLQYIENKYDTAISASHITSGGKLYKDIRIKGICKKLREIGIYGQTKTEKRLPLNYQTLTYQDTIDLLGGLFDTDGSITFNKQNTKISITQSNNIILQEIKILLRKLGIICNISKINPRIAPNRKDTNSYYTLSIAGRENIYFFNKHLKFLISYKQETLNKAVTWFNNNPSAKPCNYNWKLLKSYKIIDIKDIGVQTIYNLSAICSRTYLANNIITHNTAGDKESDFSAAQKIMYSPKAFNMQSVPNVYDKVGQGKKDFVYFYPAYVNRNGCYNKDGISDVTKAILEVLINRYNVKYNTTDANLITRTIAEHPIVPQEAIMRTRGNMFPVQSINERLNQLDNNPNEYDDVYIGNLLLQKDGTVKFSPDSNDIPIREYPLKDNKNKGAIEIYELPQKDSNGHVFAERYIIGHDPVDDDVSNTSSLTSTFVLDLLTDRIVAEYTGRQEYADSNFEIVRRLCIFYNAKCMYEQNKKGIFAYFNKMNALQWLAETPTYLKDQQIIKEIGYGNKARGVNATAAINAFADRLTREWLIKPVTITKSIKDSDEQEVTLPNLMFVRSRAFLQELAAYNPQGNFDRIRAFGMLMIYRQEKIIMYQGDMTKTVNEDRYKNLAENDEFFRENYDDRFDDFEE